MNPFVFLVAAALTACSSLNPICIVQKRFVSYAAGSLATAGKCKKPSLIEKDFNAIASKVTGCKTSVKQVPTGPIADLVCPPLSKFVGEFAASKLPEAWECDPSVSAEAVAKAFELGCKLIPVDESPEE